MDGGLKELREAFARNLEGDFEGVRNGSRLDFRIRLQGGRGGLRPGFRMDLEQDLDVEGDSGRI